MQGGDDFPISVQKLPALILRNFMGFKAARKHVCYVQVVERFIRIHPAQGAFQHPIVLNAEYLHTGPRNCLIQLLAQAAGYLISFIDDLQPGLAPSGF